MDHLDTDDDDDDVGTVGDVETVSSPMKKSPPQVDFLEWKPIHIVTSWDLDINTKVASIVIVLPTGVDCQGCKWSVLPCGTMMEVSVTWPRMVSDVDALCKHWNKMEAMSPHHPRICGIDKFFSALRNDISEKLVSTAYLHLPFKVDSTMPLHSEFVGEQGGTTRLLYVDLRSVDVTVYNKMKTQKEFTIV